MKYISQSENKINPFMPNGIYYPYQLDETISNLRPVVRVVCFNFIQILNVQSVSELYRV